MSNSDVNPLSFAQMHLNQYGYLDRAWTFKSTEDTSVNPLVLPSPAFLGSPERLAREDSYDFEGQPTDPAVCHTFTISSIVAMKAGPRGMTSTGSYEILCLRMGSHHGDSIPCYAPSGFLREGLKSLRQSGSRDCPFKGGPLSLISSEFSAETRMVSGTTSSHVPSQNGLGTRMASRTKSSHCTSRDALMSPSSSKDSSEEATAGQASSNFKQVTYTAAGLPISSRLGQKCPCTEFDQSPYVPIWNDSIVHKEFDTGEKCVSLREYVYKEPFTSSVRRYALRATKSRVGLALQVITSRQVRAKTSGEREVFIARLISRDCWSASVPSLIFANGFRETKVHTSKHGGRGRGLVGLGLDRSDSDRSILGYDMNHDNTRLPEVNPKMYSFGRNGESPWHSEEKITLRHYGGKQSTGKCLQKSTPIAIPKQTKISRGHGDEVYAYSMLEGEGRTLKGREQIRHRNNVFKLTGFLQDGD